jgi:CheY-like chemotaxis protein
MPNPIVLVADDEWLIADSLAMILNKSGFQATPVYSGEEAVGAAMELKPDYLVSDVCMCGMTGIEAAAQIRDIFPECKVILRSGNAVAVELVEAASAAGPIFGFLEKPFHPTVLLRQLKTQA